jgi:hypothetical protein
LVRRPDDGPERSYHCARLIGPAKFASDRDLVASDIARINNLVPPTISKRATPAKIQSNALLMIPLNATRATIRDGSPTRVDEDQAARRMSPSTTILNVCVPVLLAPFVTEALSPGGSDLLRLVLRTHGSRHGPTPTRRYRNISTGILHRRTMAVVVLPTTRLRMRP